MKKSLIALAGLAALTAAPAFAQSSVTLFGVVDATLAFGRAGGAGSARKTQLTNSGYNSSRLGFRGTEDLGGGMSASFWLEAGLNNDDGQGAATSATNQPVGSAANGTAFNPATGANSPVRSGTQGLTFNRRSTVSLAGGWGEIRLGRDYSPQFWNLTVFDPFGTNGVGTTQTLNSIVTGTTAVRASNSIGYFLPGNLGGFYGQAQYYMGENVRNSAINEKDGTGYALRFGYANGPVNVALAASRTDNAGTGVGGATLVGGTGDIRQNNLGGQWDFGVAKLMGHITWDQNGDIDGRGWLIGGLIPVGAGEIRLAYSRYRTETSVIGSTQPTSNKLAIGYVHNLSKRTALYTTWAHVRNRDGAASALNGATFGAGVVNQNSSGVDFGIRHSF